MSQVVSQADRRRLADQFGGRALDGVNIDDLPAAACSNLLARFERDRHGFGQYFTPPVLADLTCAFAIQRANCRILEPSAGTGVFLRSAANRLRDLGEGKIHSSACITGLELDPDLAAVARSACPDARVETGSFLESFPRKQPFDAVVGNPPFTRLRELQQVHPAGAEALARHLTKLWNVRISRRASAYIHFLLVGVACLRPGGRVAMITPNAWLDVGAASCVRDLLVSKDANLVAVIQSTAEKWFHDAEVNSVVTVVERLQPGETKVASPRFVTLTDSLLELPAGSPRIRELAEEIQNCTSESGSMFKMRSISRSVLAEMPHWSRPLRAPEQLVKIEASLQEAGQLAPLSTFVDVRRGYTTGANSFFYLSDPGGIDKRHLRPLLKSPRQFSSLELTGKDCLLSALLVDGVRQEKSLLDHIESGEELGLQNRPNCASRRPWYQLPEQPPAAMVLSKGVWSRWSVVKLAEGVVFDQQLYGLFEKTLEGPEHGALGGDVIEALWAVCNTAWTMIQAELGGRTNFGEGVLWLAAYEVGALRIPDVRSFTLAARTKVLAAMQLVAPLPVEDRDLALQRPARIRLEEAVLEACGLEPNDARTTAAALIQIATSLSRDRINRAERGRDRAPSA